MSTTNILDWLRLEKALMIVLLIFLTMVSANNNIESSKQDDTVNMDLDFINTNPRDARYLISFTETNTTTSTVKTSWWCWTTDSANPPTNTCSKR